MRTIAQAFRWVVLKLRRLRSLVKDEDQDAWYEEKSAKGDKPPNVMGPASQ